ncbi:MAG TPA: C25 family cysteine peptidase, partial [Pyrinomonadaceae bacterium]|nr:C25 family cysteine peptidase [Pyrinomonadaceae bacterium]
NPNGGAVAVWTSTGAGLPDSYGSLNVEIHRQLLSGATLGEAHLRAKRTITNDDVLKTFVLLGDPSMRLR